MVPTTLLVERSIRDSGLMGREMDMGSITLYQERDMRENGNKIRDMVMVQTTITMEQCIMGIGIWIVRLMSILIQVLLHLRGLVHLFKHLINNNRILNKCKCNNHSKCISHHIHTLHNQISTNLRAYMKM